MDPQLSDQAKNFSPGKGILDFIVTGFLSIMGSIAILNGIFSLLHIWFGRFDDKGMRIGKKGATLGWMDDVPQSLFILGIGILFLAIVWLRKQARRQNWYRSHRLIFRVGLIIVMIPIGRGGYRGLISMNGGDAIYAAQQGDTDTIRELNEKGEITDEAMKAEMMMRMAQRGHDEALAYGLSQGWPIIYTRDGKEGSIITSAGAFGSYTGIMLLISNERVIASFNAEAPEAMVENVVDGESLLLNTLYNTNLSKEQQKGIIETMVNKGILSRNSPKLQEVAPGLNISL